MFAEGRNGHDRHKITFCGQVLQVRKQACLVIEQVDFIDGKYGGNLGRSHLLQHHFIFLGERRAVDHKNDGVYIFNRRAGRPVHKTIYRLAFNFMQAGRIDKNDLVFTLGFYPQHLMPRGLRLARSDTDLLPQYMVQKRGLAHIGPPHDGYIATAAIFIFHLY